MTNFTRAGLAAAIAALVAAGSAPAGAYPLDTYELQDEVTLFNSGSYAIESVTMDGHPMTLEAPVPAGESVTFDTPLFWFSGDFCVADVAVTFADGSRVEESDLLLCLYSERYETMYSWDLDFSEDGIR